MIFNLIIILIYLLFFINYFVSLIIIPITFIYLFNKKYIMYFTIIKNIIYSAMTFIIKIFLFPNIYVNSNIELEMILTTNNKNILISNHITELDFLLSIFVFNNTSIFSKNNIISKKTVGYMIPFIGFIGLLLNDIFLNRKIEHDINKLNSKLDFNLLLLYPEGTCFNNQKKNISDNYCKNNNLINFKYHLYPRITGLELIIENNPDITYIYDLTIIYDNITKNNYGEYYNIFNFLLQKFKLPNKIFIQINKYKISKNINKFNNKKIEYIFIEKDKFIENFNINNNKFIPIKYNYLKSLLSFSFVNLFSILSIYLFFKFNFIKNLYFIQILFYYIYFFIFI
jgi:1-acyl-sn-glycerol-3-phosphate acyltransferase